MGEIKFNTMRIFGNAALLAATAILFIANTVTGQDTAGRYRVSEHLSVIFPGKPAIMDQQGNVLTFLNVPGISYAVVSRDSTPGNLHTEADFDKAMNFLQTGFLENPRIKLYKNTINDTVIGGAHGRYFHFFNPSVNVGVPEIFSFLTIQDNVFYIVQGSVLDSSMSRTSVHEFIASAQFSGKNYSKQGGASVSGSGNSKSIIWSVVGAMAVVIAVWFMSKNRRRNKIV